MGMLLEFVRRLHTINGGSRDKELKELAVKPTGLPSASKTVITVTPVTKEAKQRRKAVGSSSGKLAWVEKTVIGSDSKKNRQRYVVSGL
jgi:hypothetical protein